jgi:hypothetical protein
MNRTLGYLGQALCYALFFLPLAYFSHEPSYRVLDEGTALLKLSVRHPGKIVGECTTATTPGKGMRPTTMAQATKVCPRERSALQLQLILDGKTLYRATVPASGLHSDGIASVYRQFEVPAGRHNLQLRMSDDVALEGYPWQFEQDIELQPAQVMVANFKQGFKLQ